MRLIDADKIKPEDFYDRVNMDECMEVINEQPTAYDVDAVVRELEKEYEATIDLYHRTADAYYSGQAYGLDIAIEIVRGGRNEQMR